MAGKAPTLLIDLIIYTYYMPIIKFVPVIVCIILLIAALGNVARLYISYRSNCSSVKFDTKTLRKTKMV